MWVYLSCLTDLISFQESEDFQSHLTNGCDQSHIVKSTPTVKECSSHEWPMEFYPLHQFGMISTPFLLKTHMNRQLISYTEVFHARTSALQVLEKAWQESEAAYSSRSCVCVAKLSRDLSFWKMSLPLLPEEEMKWLGKLPRWGMIVDGALYPLRPLVHITKGNVGSYWPTPTARDWKESGSEPAAQNRKTPCLPAAVRMWPTPDASIRGARKNQNGHHYTLQDAIGSGKVNPQFVEWLMGYQTEWSALSALGIQWYHNRPKKRLKS